MSASHRAYNDEIRRQFEMFRASLKPMIKGIVKESMEQTPAIAELSDLVKILKEKHLAIEKQEKVVKRKRETIDSLKQHMKKGRQKIQKDQQRPRVIDIDELDLSLEF